jgi:hypothetical protein
MGIDSIVSKIGGRKFVLTLISVGSAIFLQYTGNLDPTGNTYFLVITAALTAYSAANVFSKKVTQHDSKTGTTTE